MNQTAVDTTDDRASATRVLVIDDSDTVIKSLKARLGARGYEVTGASDGATALELLATDSFDVVLLDLKMPRMSGLDVLRVLRRRYSATQLPVIVLTVSEDTPDILEAYRAGANDYIIKPGELPVLVARIDTQVSLRSANMALRRAHQMLERKVIHQTVEIQEKQTDLRWEQQNRIETEHELRASEQRFRLLYDDNPCMLFTVSPQGRVESVNRLGATHLGYRRGELLGTDYINTYHPEDRDVANRHLQGVLKSPGRLHRWELRKRTRAGDTLWHRETARLIEEAGGQKSILIVCEDVSENYLLSERLSFHERYDSLTGLLNRRSFTEHLGRILEKARRDDAVYALLFIDLDQFKIINDTCGHQTGDELLGRLSEILRQSIRRQDTMARMGDDEFAVLIENCDMEAALTVAESLRNAIQTHQMAYRGSMLSVTASIGILPVGRTSRDTAAVLSMADAACFAAKEAGRNRVHVYADDDLQLMTRFGEMHWVTRIKDALHHNRFHLTRQPIAHLAGGSLGEHYELLLRLTDDTGAAIPPSEFIPAAERYSLAGEIDRWVVHHALQWLGSDPAALSRLHLCDINLSGQSLSDRNVLQFIINELESSAIPPEKLCFEVTETAAINDVANAQSFIGTLRERGCRFALDDFGSGLSSFAYLKNLPVDYLKIDGVFVKDIATNSLDLALVRSINEIGHVLGKQTIAEFVEDELTMEQLRSLGVDYAQGYGIGRPTPI